MKIGIIGSGIAGLSAAWLLGRTHEVTLFERHARPGMGAFNLQYSEAGIDATIDVPLRAFNDGYYENLTALYAMIGVETSHADHSAGFSMKGATSDFLSYRYLGWRKSAFPMMDNLRSLGLSSLLIAKDMAVFQLVAPRDLAAGRADDMTVLDYLETAGYSRVFIDRLMLPTLAAIGTCTYEAAAAYPAALVIKFYAGGLLFNNIWRAQHGADDAIDRMLANSRDIRCNTSVTRVESSEDGSGVQVDFDGGSAQFDHVVIASQANQARELVAHEEAEASALLSKIDYQASELVVHSDPKFAPARGRSTAPLQFLLDPLADKPMASIQLNHLYPQLKKARPIFQTWNPLVQPDEDYVLGRAMFERPVVTLESLAALKSLAQLHQQPGRRIWYCGSYAVPGIPLQESGVQSAMVIAARLDCPAPWLVAAAEERAA
ncbi:FAD-dependent oxidoreductase [Allohahella marinimesophila]|uniref:NAD(P)-binding protein n=1 Tax=Allohahella marinimesophila TaxID=1054972 RepID=A0ABP7PS45_9GAMM